MTVKELKGYLDRFPEEKELVVIAVNPPERKKYDVTGLVALTELEFPVIGIELGQAHGFDEEETAATEEDEGGAE